MSLNNLPMELREFHQWAVAGQDDKGRFKAPYIAKGTELRRTMVQARHLHPFDHACAAADYFQNTGGVGFILREDDPYTVIDLDICNAATQRAKGEPEDASKWTTQEEIDRYVKIVQTFDSYTEISAGGYGLHIWVKGNIGKGCRRGGVEVYSQERFIICTGNVYINKPIAYHQELLHALTREMRGIEYEAKPDLIEVESAITDQDLINKAMLAENSVKFTSLCRGEWHGHYPSQSEADLALMAILCFYSPSNEQCRRIFRMTELGKRKKAIQNNRHLDYMLSLVRARQESDKANIEHGKKIAEGLLAEVSKQPLDVSTVSVPTKPITEIASKKDIVEAGLDWPPGTIGEIARYIFASAPRPVKEVAIVAALGFIAGICGKAFTIPQSGLNVYITLVAQSGVGKEAMHSGISNIMSSLREITPSVEKFIDFSDYASGQALIKAAAANPSFLHVNGEWGKQLVRLARDEKGNTPLQYLRTVMTNLYSKSGPNSTVGGINYSDKEKNIASITGVAYSMIGETTPGTFYDALTEQMMEDGFMSRFIIVEYNGDRPARNKNAIVKVPPDLLESLAQMVTTSATLNSKYQNCEVGFSKRATEILDKFDSDCDNEVNSSVDESYRQLWSRAHLKALRISALLAVADNFYDPVIQETHVDWAINLICKNITVLQRRLGAGDIGSGDSTRETKLLALLYEYLQRPPPPSHKVPEDMRRLGIIPKRYLSSRIRSVSAFAHDKRGAITAMNVTLQSLVDNGYLIEIQRMELDKMPSTIAQGKCYRILSCPKPLGVV